MNVQAKKFVIIAALGMMVSGASALDINDSDPLQYYSGGDLDFEVATNGDTDIRGDLLMGSGQEILNYYEPQCGEFRAVKGIHPNGTYICTDKILEEKTEYLNETLAAGNTANDNILMQENDVRGLGAIEGGAEINVESDLDMLENNIQNISAIQDGNGVNSIVLNEDNTVSIPNNNLLINSNNITGIDNLQFSSNVTIGDSSTKATGPLATVVGNSAEAHIWGSSFGENSYAAERGLALGKDADAQNYASISIGALSQATENRAVAIGQQAIAPNANEATFGNLNGNELSLNVTGNATIHGSKGLSIAADSKLSFSNSQSNPYLQYLPDFNTLIASSENDQFRYELKDSQVLFKDQGGDDELVKILRTGDMQLKDVDLDMYGNDIINSQGTDINITENIDLNSNDVNDVSDLYQDDSQTNFFQTECAPGNVIKGINSDGTYNCVPTEDQITDIWVNESGDNMTGDLDMNDNDIIEVDEFRTDGSGSDVVAVRDTSQSNDLAQFREGGTFRVPNGRIQVNGSSPMVETTPTSNTINNGFLIRNAAGSSLGAFSADANGQDVLIENRQGQKITFNTIGTGSREFVINPGGPTTLDTAGTNAMQIDSAQNVNITNGNLDVQGGVLKDSTGVLTIGDGSVEVPNGNIQLEGNRIVDTTGSETVYLGDGSSDTVDVDAGGSGTFIVRTGDTSGGSTQRIQVTAASGTADVDVTNADVDLSNNNLERVEKIDSDGSNTNINLIDGGAVGLPNGDLNMNDNNVNNVASIDGGGDEIQADDGINFNQNNATNVRKVGFGDGNKIKTESGRMCIGNRCS